MFQEPFDPENMNDDSGCVVLQNVFVHVTKACNLDCSYCYFSARKAMPNEMSTDEYVAIWPQLAALRPQQVILTGGEPFTRKDIFALLHGLKAADPSHNIKRCINTNGHLVTSDIARNLVGLADEVRVSLDGLRNLNDSLRGQGNFDAALRALQIFYNHGFEPKVLITVTSVNVADLEELMVLLHKHKLTQISLNNFRPIGRGEGQWNLRADPALVLAALERGWRRCYPHEPLPPAQVEQEQSRCGVGTMINILPNGDVFPCHVLTHPEFRIGNLREQSLVDLCRKSGLLGQLTSLDFRELARLDVKLNELTESGTCMGNVYTRSRESLAWGCKLPSLGREYDQGTQELFLR